MADQSKIEVLLARLEQVLRRQDAFVREIAEIKEEILRLQSTSQVEKAIKPAPAEPGLKPSLPLNYNKENPSASSPSIPRKRSDIEKFIGENLINKIGIIITVLGVAIGVKYSVENDLISPLYRVLLGYLSGFILLGFGLKFKKKYENYSAVLVSGAVALMYFITYAAYGFYDIFSQGFAFGLMLIFTALTVVTAIKYNRQVIAHIGMVGAYAIPFLLGDDSGRAWILFSYMAIINLGILIIAFRKYWKPLFYAVFMVTWLIYSVWLFNDFLPSAHTVMALGFAGIFFGIFYLTFLGYKLIHKEKYNMGDVGLLLANSFIYYGLGYYILSGNVNLEQYLGIYTVINACIHGLIALLLRSRFSMNRDLYYLIIGLSIVFLTIAVPVQLDAGWVTSLWAGEAALLFWIGRTRNSPAYEKIGYGVMFLAFISLLLDWEYFYFVGSPVEGNYILPLWNRGFLTSLFFLIAFGFIVYLDRNKPGTPPFPISLGLLNRMVKYAVPAVFMFSLYYAFRIEIETYWQQKFIASGVDFQSADAMDVARYNNFDLQAFKAIWIINYSLLFLTVLTFINIKRLRSKELGLVVVGFSIITLLVFLSQGLIVINELRQSHLNQAMAEYYSTGLMHVWIRYISMAFAVILLVITYRYVHKDLTGLRLKVPYDLFMHLAIIIMASSELLTWLNTTGTYNSSKLGLSILWGLYSLLLIGIGINRNKKHLRVAAIVLFGLTLVKLFIYDISDLNTISKTIVFVCLGILLLVISFLYNKYKSRISGV